VGHTPGNEHSIQHVCLSIFIASPFKHSLRFSTVLIAGKREASQEAEAQRRVETVVSERFPLGRCLIQIDSNNNNRDCLKYTHIYALT
jgi:hypothetical protein